MPLIVELDSLTVVRLLNGSLHSRKEIGWLVSEIIGLMANRSRIIMKHVPRSCNLVAHNRAKLAFSFPDGYTWIKDPPIEIVSLL